jgi:hypothetical protein
MYEAVVRMNDSSRRPAKLELFFCPALARDLDWHHEAKVIFRFHGTPERWSGTIGLPRHNPYLWTNVELLSVPHSSAEEGRKRPISELLHRHGLSPKDRVPLRIDENGDLLLDVTHHRAGNSFDGESSPTKRRSGQNDYQLGTFSSQSAGKVRRFPLGDKAAIDELAKRYWEVISHREYDAEFNRIPQIVQRARERGYLKTDEFITLASWKSTRPLRRYVANHWRFIKTQTANSLAAVSRDDGLKYLDALAGVGLRTATAILHWFRPSDTPILDQRIVRALGHRLPKDWENIDFYREIAGEIVREARRAGVNLRTMDRALWVWDKLNRS